MLSKLCKTVIAPSNNYKEIIITTTTTITTITTITTMINIP